MIPFKLSIEKCENGYVLEWDEESTDEIPVIYRKKQVVEGLVDEAEPYTTRDLLWAILSHFNLEGSKHDPERISIKIDKNKEYK